MKSNDLEQAGVGFEGKVGFEENRANFLQNLAKQFGRALQTEVKQPFQSTINYPKQRLTELNPEQLWQTFSEYANESLKVDCLQCLPAEAKERLNSLCEKYGGGDIVLNDDKRLQDLGLTQMICENYSSHIWSSDSADKNRSFAEQANIGISFAEYGLVESGGVVLFSSVNVGRSTSLLPKVSIVVLLKSSLLPRVAQLSEILDNRAKNGERMPSCINLISGPSSTADIELIKVIGVHGPTSQVYLVIDDIS